MRIQISEATKKLLEHSPKYEIELRGKLTIKGKGEMNTYFVQPCTKCPFVAAFEDIRAKKRSDLCNGDEPPNTKARMSSTNGDFSFNPLDLNFTLLKSSVSEEGMSERSHSTSFEQHPLSFRKSPLP